MPQALNWLCLCDELAQHRVGQEQTGVREAQIVAAEGDSVIVLFDYRAQKSIQVPDDMRSKIAVLEGQLP